MVRDKMRKISIAIPVHDFKERKYYIMDNCNLVKNDDRVTEIVLCMEPSLDNPSVLMKLSSVPKVRIFVNEKRQYVFRNKYIAISQCKNEWVIILDSDNTIGKNYIDSLYDIADWNSDTVYQPDYLMPKFDLRRFSNKLYERKSVAQFMDDAMFRTMLNAMNYLAHRDTFLRNNKPDFDSGYDPKCADSLFINYNLMNNGGAIQVVKGMYYNHTIHEGSFYKQNSKQYGYINKEIENKIRSLS